MCRTRISYGVLKRELNVYEVVIDTTTGVSVDIITQYKQGQVRK